MPSGLVLPAYSFAFQPIVDVIARRVVSYEALIRGPQGQSAGSVFAAVPSAAIYEFDERIRITAVKLFSTFSSTTQLNLNFLPRSLELSASAIQSTLDAANACHVPLGSLVIEVTEDEVIDDHARFATAMNRYRSQGVRVAVDDFGAGYSGLNLLANFQPDVLKLDLKLVRGIETHGPRQAIVRASKQICDDLGIDVVAEGVETTPEYNFLEAEGVRLFQGYLFAKPGFECLPVPILPTDSVMPASQVAPP